MTKTTVRCVYSTVDNADVTNPDHYHELITTSMPRYPHQRDRSVGYTEHAVELSMFPYTGPDGDKRWAMVWDQESELIIWDAPTETDAEAHYDIERDAFIEDFTSGSTSQPDWDH